MCGIAGIAEPGARIERDVLARMASALRHRGPDASRLLQLPGLGIAHTRLAIMDLSAAADQPMAERAWRLCYNGEIFEHEALRRELPAHAYRGHGDAETLLHGLACHGPRALLPRLNGFFAFAAVDLTARRLYLARDRFGIKPLYVGRQGGRLWFASEIGAILDAGFPRVPRADVLGAILRERWTNGRDTPIAGIERVLPGTLLDVDLETGAVCEERWTDPAAAADAAFARELAACDRRAAAALLDDALSAATRARLCSDVPLGTLCSGGLDSSLVTALAARALPGVVAYQGTLPDQPAFDEGPWGAAVARALGIELRTVPLDAAAFRRHFARSVVHFEYPLVHESSVALAAIAHRASADGVTVLLGGEGADELFGGYASRHLAERSAFAPARSVVRTAARDPLHELLRGITRGARGTRAAAFERQTRRRARDAYAHHPAARGTLEAALASDLSLFLSHALNRVDKNLMQESVEFREPFLDPRVVRLALNLPLELRLGPALKGILRDVGRRYLPPAIVDREKVGFSFDSGSLLAPQIDPGALRHGALRDVLGVSAHVWEPFVAELRGRTFFRVLSAEVWCRAFVHGDGVAAIDAALYDRTAVSGGSL